MMEVMALKPAQPVRRVAKRQKLTPVFVFASRVTRRLLERVVAEITKG